MSNFDKRAQLAEEFDWDLAEQEIAALEKEHPIDYYEDTLNRFESKDVVRLYAIGKKAFENLKQGNDEPSKEYIQAIKDLMFERGYEDVRDLNIDTPTEAQLFAEMINCSAKKANYEFYGFKGFGVAYAMELGAEGGWDYEKNILHLYTQEGGVNSFHDDSNEISNYLSPEQNATTWPHPWSKIPRQPEAYELIQSYLGQDGGEFLKKMAEDTAPGRVHTHEDELEVWDEEPEEKLEMA